MAVLCCAAASCGGGGDADTPGSTAAAAGTDRAEWVAQLDAACDELNQEYDRLVSADPADLEEAVAYAGDVESFAADLVDVLDRAGVPAGDREAADQLAADVDALAEAAADLADAAEQGDAGAAADAGDELVRIGGRINRSASALGVPACGGF